MVLLFFIYFWQFFKQKCFLLHKQVHTEIAMLGDDKLQRVYCLWECVHSDVVVVVVRWGGWSYLLTGEMPTGIRGFQSSGLTLLQSSLRGCSVGNTTQPYLFRLTWEKIMVIWLNTSTHTHSTPECRLHPHTAPALLCSKTLRCVVQNVIILMSSWWLKNKCKSSEIKSSSFSGLLHLDKNPLTR